MRVLPANSMWKTRSAKEYADIVKAKGQEFVIGQILNLIKTSSKNNLITLAKFLENMAGSEGSARHAQRLRWLFETDHPHLEWWQKIISELDPNTRNKWIMNFFVHGYYGDNQRKRAAFKEKNGFFPPSVLLTSITQRCNFDCKGCWAHNYEKKEDMSYETLRRVMKEARDEMGVHIMTVVGGEPFIREDYLKLAEEFNDCAFITFTNGSLLDDEMIAKIKNLGNIHPMFSLGGWKEQTDAVRGEGCFDMVMEKMDKLKKEGIFFGASLAATRSNTADLVSDEYFKMLSRKGALWAWVFHYVPVGENPDPDIMPTPTQRELIQKAVYNARNTLPMLTVDGWGDGPEMMGCIAGGRQVIHVNAKGDVEPCAFVHLASHNIHNCTLTEALAAPFMKAVRENIQYDGNLLRPCMIVDHPQVLRHYYEKFNLYETHKGAADSLTKPEIIEKINKYSKEVKELQDYNWHNDLYMTLFPLKGEYYHDRKVLCSSKVPCGGRHGGCEANGGCTCGKDLSAIEDIANELT